MMRVLFLCLLVACSGDDDDGPAPGRGAQGVIEGAPADLSAAERRANDPFRQRRPSPRIGMDTIEARLRATSMMAEAPTMGPERNFAAELQGAAGSPMSCGDMGGLTGDIVIPLSATVSQQGRVTRASVGGAIPAATRDCMRQRIEAHRFAPIPDGPRSITASLHVSGTPGETMMSEAPMTGFALQAGQQGIAGPNGVGISTTMAREISNYGTMQAGAVTIMGPTGSTISEMTTGVTIMGPTGTSIAQ